MPTPNRSLWEMLVPVTVKGLTVPKQHHQLWDAEVRKVSQSLTILSPARSQWVTPLGCLQVERMSPVRIICTKREIARIATLTARHYKQEAVMYCELRRHVRIRRYGPDFV